MTATPVSTPILIGGPRRLVTATPVSTPILIGRPRRLVIPTPVSTPLLIGRPRRRTSWLISTATGRRRTRRVGCTSLCRSPESGTSSTSTRPSAPTTTGTVKPSVSVRTVERLACACRARYDSLQQLSAMCKMIYVLPAWIFCSPSVENNVIFFAGIKFATLTTFGMCKIVYER